MFKALVLNKQDDGSRPRSRSSTRRACPRATSRSTVEYSTLNYKDGLIIENKAPLVRSYPHVPGHRLRRPRGRERASRLAAGRRRGPDRLGRGRAQLGRLCQARPRQGRLAGAAAGGLAHRQAMAVGTAGFTAMLAVMALENHGLEPGAGEVLVTGAAGGVGSVAIALLAKLGHQVTASTGRAASHDYLRSLGASAFIDRAELAEPSSRPLESERFAGCIDTVGGTTLARVLGQMQYRCSVAAVGLAGGSELRTTVIPFLLRGVNLLGIDSVYQPAAPRRAAWQRLARDLDLVTLEGMIVEAGLQDLPRLAGDILQGRVQGRVVVDPHRGG